MIETHHQPYRVAHLPDWYSAVEGTYKAGQAFNWLVPGQLESVAGIILIDNILDALHLYKLCCRSIPHSQLASLELPKPFQTYPTLN